MKAIQVLSRRPSELQLVQEPCLGQGYGDKSFTQRWPEGILAWCENTYNCPKVQELKRLCQFFDALTHEKYFEFKSLHVRLFLTGEKGSVNIVDKLCRSCFTIWPVWRNWWQKVPQLLLQLTRQCWRTGLSLGKLASTKIAICKKCFRRYSSKLLQCPSFKL